MPTERDARPEDLNETGPSKRTRWVHQRIHVPREQILELPPIGHRDGESDYLVESLEFQTSIAFSLLRRDEPFSVTEEVVGRRFRDPRGISVSSTRSDSSPPIDPLADDAGRQTARCTMLEASPNGQNPILEEERPLLWRISVMCSLQSKDAQVKDLAGPETLLDDGGSNAQAKAMDVVADVGAAHGRETSLRSARESAFGTTSVSTRERQARQLSR